MVNCFYAFGGIFGAGPLKEVHCLLPLSIQIASTVAFGVVRQFNKAGRLFTK
jgi:hypothetical protein